MLVGIGDSITNGLGASKKHNYFALLQDNDDEAYPDMAGRDLTAVQAGVCGLHDITSRTVEGVSPQPRLWFSLLSLQPTSFAVCPKATTGSP